MDMNASSRWILRRAVPNARLRLICFPYAGGCAGAFQPWMASMPYGVDLCAVQLPGRANRMNEPAVCQLPLLVSALAREISPWLDLPVVFFGHSLGALLSFELARYLQDRCIPAPNELIVSGCRAPQISAPARKLYNLGDVEFIKALRDIGGTPEAILNEPRLIALIAPYLRADLQAFETYAYSPGKPLDCPIRAFAGVEDSRAPLPEVSAWCDQTANAFSLRTFPGAHFFVHTSEALVLDAMRQILLHIMCGTSLNHRIAASGGS
jgi:medium-chain acyl-[acyl-carrier-protein] hydrolase